MYGTLQAKYVEQIMECKLSLKLLLNPLLLKDITVVIHMKHDKKEGHKTLASKSSSSAT